MSIDLNNGYEELRQHVGHEIVVVVYRDGYPDGDPMNVALECETCNMVLLDFDHPEVRNP